MDGDPATADDHPEYNAFEDLARRLVNVPKDEVDAEREREKAAKRS